VVARGASVGASHTMRVTMRWYNLYDAGWSSCQQALQDQRALPGCSDLCGESTGVWAKPEPLDDMRVYALIVERGAVGMGLLNCTGGGAGLDDGTRRVRPLKAHMRFHDRSRAGPR
jgi:hypothetical protein